MQSLFFSSSWCKFSCIIDNTKAFATIAKHIKTFFSVAIVIVVRTYRVHMAQALRVLICGDFGIGKSSFIARYVVSI